MNETQRRKDAVTKGRRQACEYHPQDGSRAADSVLTARLSRKEDTVLELATKPGVLSDEELFTLGMTEFDRQRTAMLIEDRRAGRCVHR